MIITSGAGWQNKGRFSWQISGEKTTERFLAGEEENNKEDSRIERTIVPDAANRMSKILQARRICQDAINEDIKGFS
jgi:hypothetical protein